MLCKAIYEVPYLRMESCFLLMILSFSLGEQAVVGSIHTYPSKKSDARLYQFFLLFYYASKYTFKYIFLSLSRFSQFRSSALQNEYNNDPKLMYLHVSTCWCGEPTDYRSPKKLVFIYETRRDFSFLDIASSDISSETESPLLYLYWYSFASVERISFRSPFSFSLHTCIHKVVYCAESDEV